MSEIITTRVDRNFRWHLLATVSAASLFLIVTASNEAGAEGDNERPVVWIELGPEFQHLNNTEQLFSPPAFSLISANGYDAPAPLQKPPSYSFGGEGKISFHPKGSEWILSAAVQYGRANGKKYRHQQTNTVFYSIYTKYNYALHQNVVHSNPLLRAPVKKFSDISTSHRESHVIVDFQVGRDVGLGMFGRGGTSVVNAGVRYAQFGTGETAAIGARPDVQVVNVRVAPLFLPSYHFHQLYGTSDSASGFHGIGPALSWNASLPVATRGEDAAFTLDWGVNAAVLFGRQRASAYHRTYEGYLQHRGGIGIPVTAHLGSYENSTTHSRRHSVTVPNLGAFAGMSLKFPNAKLSFGYRADFFFGAMDGGLDARKTYDRDFHGPFASISIGLGG